MQLDKLLTAYRRDGYNLSFRNEVKSGKEATLFAVQSDGQTLALKVYKNPSQRAFKHTEEYLQGRWYRNSSERKAVARKNRFSREFLFEKWVQREYFLLEQLYERHVRVPEPFACVEHSILMEFLGDDGVPAPRLIDVALDKAAARRALTQLLQAVRTMLDLGIVHSDLSPYNLLWWHDAAYIIDLPQAIDVRTNPNRNTLLRRDLEHAMNYFKRFTPIDKATVLRSFDL